MTSGSRPSHMRERRRPFRIDAYTKDELQSMNLESSRRVKQGREDFDKAYLQSRISAGQNSTDARYFDKDYGFQKSKIWNGSGWKTPDPVFMLPINGHSHFPETKSYPVHGTAGPRESGGRSGASNENYVLSVSKPKMVDEGEGKYSGGYLITPRRDYQPQQDHNHGLTALNFEGRMKQFRRDRMAEAMDEEEASLRMQNEAARRMPPPTSFQYPGEPQPYVYTPKNPYYKTTSVQEYSEQGQPVIRPRPRPPGYVSASYGDPFFDAHYYEE